MAARTAAPAIKRRLVTGGRLATGSGYLAPSPSRRQIRFVTAGTSSLSADSFSSRAHCAITERTPSPPPRPHDTNAGWLGSRPALAIILVAVGRQRDCS